MTPLGTPHRSASLPAVALQPRAARALRPVCKLRPLGAEEGPGTGARRYPKPVVQEREQLSSKTFECKTTLQCYEEFPFLVKTSQPLRVEDREPAGLGVQRGQGAGPATGKRRRPAAVDAEALRRPPALPHPAAPKDLKKELFLRTHILLAA